MNPKKTTAWCILSPERDILTGTICDSPVGAWKCFNDEDILEYNKIYSLVEVSITPLLK